MIREVYILTIDRIRYTDWKIGDAPDVNYINSPRITSLIPPWIHPRSRELN